MVSLFRVCGVVVCLLLPLSVFAAGGHDGLSCTGCHSIHDAKDDLIFAVKANKKDINPRTKQPFSTSTALCLGCHQSPEKGGMGIAPISAHISHPYGIRGIDPKTARVNSSLLRDGNFECVSCHDPHPSNPNYRYLRIDTAKGSKMENFCAACHPMKADPKTATPSPNFFDSMDDRKFGVSIQPSAPKAPEAAPAPAKR